MKHYYETADQGVVIFNSEFYEIEAYKDKDSWYDGGAEYWVRNKKRVRLYTKELRKLGYKEITVNEKYCTTQKKNSLKKTGKIK